MGVPLLQALHDVLLTRMATLADSTRSEWMGLPPGETGPFRRMDHLLPPDWLALQETAGAS